jgi:aspartyl-tRNA synthetase
MTYAESMERYGTDRPDLRFGMELKDLTESGRNVRSRIIEGALAEGFRLKGLVVPEAGDMSRGQLDRLNDEVRANGGKGIIWIKRADGFKSSLKLEEEDFLKLWNESAAQSNDLLLLVADEKDRASHILGDLRLRFRPEGLPKENSHIFVWITDFPMFEWSEADNRLVAMHHPFTSPLEEDLPLLDAHPLEVRANAYDLVLNGMELGGGSVRIHDSDLQKRIFEVLGLEPDETQQKFGFFLEALRYGTPPHGGIAYGFDRIVMFLCGEESIREVIPFPKTTSSLCLLTEAPTAVEQRQLTELGLTLTDDKPS